MYKSYGTNRKTEHSQKVHSCEPFNQKNSLDNQGKQSSKYHSQTRLAHEKQTAIRRTGQ